MILNCLAVKTLVCLQIQRNTAKKKKKTFLLVHFNVLRTMPDVAGATQNHDNLCVAD